MWKNTSIYLMGQSNISAYTKNIPVLVLIYANRKYSKYDEARSGKGIVIIKESFSDQK